MSKGSSGVDLVFLANGRNDDRRVDRDVGFRGDGSVSSVVALVVRMFLGLKSASSGYTRWGYLHKSC